MFGLLLLLLFGGWLLFLKEPKQHISKTSERVLHRIESLWKIAQDAIKNEKYLKAEKALLTILRVDEKNAAAYNRLGILYAKQNQLEEALECFEIAQSLEPSINNLHNVGLICYNLGEYQKSALAFQQALDIDDTLASRHIAFAKVQEKLGNIEKAIASLEKAISIEENPQTLKMLALMYHHSDQSDLAKNLYYKSMGLINKQTKPLLESTASSKVQ